MYTVFGSQSRSTDLTVLETQRSVCPDLGPNVFLSIPPTQSITTQIFRGFNTHEVLPGNKCSCSISRLCLLVLNRDNLLVLLDSINSCYIPEKRKIITSLNIIM